MLRPVDRWAGADGEYDRWAGADREYDRWAGADREYDRRGGADREYDLWTGTDRQYDRPLETGDQYDRWAGADREFDHWADADRERDRLAENDGRYDRRDVLTGSARRPRIKWIGLFLAWVIVTGLLLAVHLTILIWVIMVGLIGYVVYSIRRDTPHVARPRRRQAAPLDTADDAPERFNAPPGWPEPPPGWTPPPGWQPNPAWPPAPPGWQFWLPPVRRGFDQRTTRIRHHRSEPDDGRFTERWR
jgi:hypothetical protein